MPTLATGSRFDVKPGTVESYIWRLIRTADKLRAEWAESNTARRKELWRNLHTASDIATAALEEGPAEAERMEQAERAHRDRERLLASAETAAGLPAAVAQAEVPGYEGTVGPFKGQYGRPHVYARDVHSGSGNCVCGHALGYRLHTETAPGVPVPESRR